MNIPLLAIAFFILFHKVVFQAVGTPAMLTTVG
jgi:hypothetical protein